MSIAREWDGATYDRVSGPMEAMGLEVLERLELRGDETVVDAGCGSGRITAALLERLPRGRVIAVDGAPPMIEAARERLGERPNLELRVADLCELELGEPADAILSTATFHWIKDHAQLFGRLRAALRAGGQLAAQCGGHGNIRVVREAGEAVGAQPPFAEYLGDWEGPWRYAEPQETEELLAAAGFASARCWLEPRPVRPEDPRTYHRNIIMGAHLGRLPDELHDPFLDAVFARLDDPSLIPYVRLNIDAVA
jgi:trans-aconitate 2-methyltransferase